MAVTTSNVTLKSGQTYMDSKNGATIIGTAGNETVSIASKITDATISNVGNVKLSGKIADYTLNDSGDKVIVMQGNTTIAAITPTTHGTTLAYADGSKTTLILNQSIASHHLSTIQMVAKTTLTPTDGDVSIMGAPGGFETVDLNKGVHNVTVDSNVEKVVVNANLSDLGIAGIKGGLSLTGSNQATIADLMIAQGKNEILQFNNASGTLSLVSGKGVFNLTSINLSAGDTYAATGSGITFTAGSPSDATTVILSAGLNKEHVGSAIGEVDLAGRFSDYKYLSKSGVLYVYDSKGTTVIADIQIQNDSNGTTLGFSDSTHLSATLHNGTIQIGASHVSATKPAIITMPAPSTPLVSSGSNFQFALTMGNFGQYQSTIQADITAALNNLGKYLNAKGVFNVQVLPETVAKGIIAEASGNMASTPSSLLNTEHNANTVTDFQIESLTGNDPNPSGFDAVVKINMANIARLNLNANASPSSTQIDLVTALTHEMIHSIGFSGYTGYTTSNKTPFDTYITLQGGNPYFTGPNAEAVYGGPVPLAPASAGKGSAYFHVDVPNDLMATSLSSGEVRTVSSLDLAILKDIGVPEITLVGTQLLHG